jgi:hypothetical protein
VEFFGANRILLPKLVWGTGYVNTLEFGKPPEKVKAYSTPHEEAESVITRDGGQTTWRMAHDQMLECLVAAIPPVNELTSYGILATGWDGPTGWAAMLRWAQGGRVLQYFPSRDAGSYISAYLHTPRTTPPGSGWNMRRDVTLALRSTDNTPFAGY